MNEKDNFQIPRKCTTENMMYLRSLENQNKRLNSLVAPHYPKNETFLQSQHSNPKAWIKLDDTALAKIKDETLKNIMSFVYATNEIDLIMFRLELSNIIENADDLTLKILKLSLKRLETGDITDPKTGQAIPPKIRINPGATCYPYIAPDQEAGALTVSDPNLYSQNTHLVFTSSSLTTNFAGQYIVHELTHHAMMALYDSKKNHRINTNINSLPYFSMEEQKLFQTALKNDEQKLLEICKKEAHDGREGVMIREPNNSLKSRIVRITPRSLRVLLPFQYQLAAFFDASRNCYYSNNQYVFAIVFEQSKSAEYQNDARGNMRDSEVIARYFQVLSDIGKEETRRILPNLSKYVEETLQPLLDAYQVPQPEHQLEPEESNKCTEWELPMARKFEELLLTRNDLFTSNICGIRDVADQSRVFF